MATQVDRNGALSATPATSPLQPPSGHRVPPRRALPRSGQTRRPRRSPELPTPSLSGLGPGPCPSLFCRAASFSPLLPQLRHHAQATPEPPHPRGPPKSPGHHAISSNAYHAGDVMASFWFASLFPPQTNPNVRHEVRAPGRVTGSWTRNEESGGQESSGRGGRPSKATPV